MATLANIYQLRNGDKYTFYRILEDRSPNPIGNTGEEATMQEIEVRIRNLYPDVQIVPTIAFSIEVFKREGESFASWPLESEI